LLFYLKHQLQYSSASVTTSGPSKNPPSLFELPDVQDGALGKLVRRELFIALLPFILLAAGSLVATHRLPAGKAFVLESRGVGIFYDFMGAFTLFVLFGFIYMAPTLWVRRSIALATG
jgi:hypothetical protein